MDNTYILIAFGVVAFAALLYLIYRQMNKPDPKQIPTEMPAQDEPESDSYYQDESEIYSD